MDLDLDRQGVSCVSGLLLDTLGGDNIDYNNVNDTAAAKPGQKQWYRDDASKPPIRNKQSSRALEPHQTRGRLTSSQNSCLFPNRQRVRG